MAEKDGRDGARPSEWNSGWAANVYLVLAYAQLQPEVLYDETIIRRGLEGLKVLVLVDCDVLTASVARKIGDFQQKGGIIIGNDRLCPAVKPDVRLASFERPKQAREARALLLQMAADLRRQLDARYQQPGAAGI